MAIISFINNEYQIKSIVFILYKFLTFLTCLMEPQKVKILTLLNEQTKEQDQYALSLKPLGQGKYAKVYKATNLKDQSKVFAAKVIKITSEEVKQDYLKQLKIIKNLPNCPNIVRTHKQHLQSQNNLYIFQQYCQSGTLASYKTQKLGIPFTQPEIYDLFYQTTNGLIFLLQAGIAHQDIKPVNILKKGPIFKLCDFGVSEIQAQYVQTTTRKGTISYMPPQKLKVKKFVPGDKSDIYSLGICLYQVIFGIHPYLKKKTGNYKEYLAALQQATLLPLPFLMKKINSMSLKLENFFKFLERMIDLNVKNRIGLKELKQFLAKTQPFKDMQAIYEQKMQDQQRKGVCLNNNQIQDLFESVIIFKREDYEDNLGVSSNKKNYTDTYNKQLIAQRYNLESEYLMGVISLLIGAIDIIRRQNYTNLNLKKVAKNIMDIDLSQCKVSRYIKYLTYEFSIQVLKKFISNYQNSVDYSIQDKLTQNKAYLQRQFNKFLIQCDFNNKELLADRLKNDTNSLTLLQEIRDFYQQLVNSVVVIEENKRLSLLSTLYCITIPQILQKFKEVKSIFDQQSIQQFKKLQKYNQQQMIKGQQLLLQINKLQKYKKQLLKVEVQKRLQKLNRDFLFDIDQDSGQIEIMSQEIQS